MEIWQNFTNDTFYICMDEIILLMNFTKLPQLQL